MNRLPIWFRQEIPDTTIFKRIRGFRRAGINTVCQEAHCPNLVNCWRRGQATFMILGRSCSRHCRFCAVDVDKNHQKLNNIDPFEPVRIAKLIDLFNIRFAVVTSVTRDDLPLGGAEQFVRTIEAIRLLCQETKIELLIPDFQGNAEALRVIIEAKPEVIAHNLETVARLYPQIRPQADYRRSLEVLSKIKELKPDLTTKSSLMLGLGEKRDEVIETLKDLVNTGCEILTLGQYLAPSKNHYPVKEFVSIEQFERYRQMGLDFGFKAVLSGPLVRSSYHAEEAYQCMI